MTDSNTSDSSNSDAASSVSKDTFFGYYSLLMIIFGTVFNLLTFAILCRRTFRDVQVRPALHYMRTVVLIDFVGLYGWNLDNYLLLIHGFALNYSYTVASCKFFSFFNYFIPYVSAWLRVFICLDRYLSVSRLQPNTWFNRSRNVLIIIGSVIGFFALFNFHFLIFVCYRDETGQIFAASHLYTVFPTFDRIRFVLYNCIPFLLMISLNSLSIYHLIRLQHTTTVRNPRIRHRAISVTLILSSCLFLVTATPTAVSYSFFYDTLAPTVWGSRLLNSCDLLLYTFPVLNLPIYLLTFSEFRREFVGLIVRQRRVAPLIPRTRNAPTIEMPQIPNMRH